MKIAFVADTSSPIARNWIRYFESCPGYEVLALSLTGRSSTSAASKDSLKNGILNQLKSSRFAWLRTSVASKYFLARAIKRGATIRRKLEAFRPDIVHAMRIPYEGISVASLDPAIPLLISIWGNDFTLHAKSDRFVAAASRRLMRRANAIHADCYRDARLAVEYGFPTDRPVAVMPGAGGVQSETFYRGESDHPLAAAAKGKVVITNPRGIRAYVRMDVFFQAVSVLLQDRPDILVALPNTESSAVARQLHKSIGAPANVILLPEQSRQEMGALFRLSDMVVSPSNHDGTPNTLLEAMACGSFPVAGDIESVREWITDGENGLLCDPNNVQELAAAMKRAVDDIALRDSAASRNSAIIDERARYDAVMKAAEEFYRTIARSRT